ncbi:MAG: heme ABC exporter ATP-binding protein CcmA [Candidatus Dactylopiibacterium carminicum]|uniref:Cytochrome c biogenesis heme-transporting ATPase CcmA n=1 Tax=Candidatus Dactylopiibacterium carminicum TaxID=857335 RepID=A0A272EXR8_9RHOO|nr:cytochrome c biogenesis heme-transporting ATPase CcmA [Candidatus Dactylopiibacterium carminicum]KAF7600174.1 cytochrome c biogenesis heme-transporting ATPase CcmA [Candidatus Dactylopiibacterium carminicum]PAS94836.1 MAG: heme ABC exporter ATP-binding protein CcmA [Candidatus Dactylopiibacterium carminicum]PAS97759.1 MAG: heme ABC exporter ATP-binding protein CcmA [Candidatus Dactylopiibacterium carminicum]PAT00176.1 MAG: heme ABC transporter ATP-binding protein CcmA [Candidatus Dactylopiib
MLELRQLACQRDERLLFRRLALNLTSGGLLRVEGDNGCGKSSLLRQLAGLLEPAAGEILWRGSDLRRQREAFPAELCYLGHASATHDRLDAVENLRFACAAAGLDAPAEACRAALAETGLQRQLGLPCRVLSQGQRRRVALARLAFAVDRPLWLLDEPFASLDVNAVAALAARIDAHCAHGGLVVFSSHQEVPLRMPVQRLQLAEYAP